MSKEKYNQIIDEAYKNFLMTSKKGVSKEILEKFIKHTPNIHKVEFIDKIKTNKEFSEKWGLNIEERKLSLEERSVIAGSNHNEVSQNIKMFTGIDEDDTLHKHLDSINVPTKLISVTYNKETIEVYDLAI